MVGGRCGHIITLKIIGRGCSLRQLSQGCYMPITPICTMVTQKYVIKSHFIITVVK